MSVQGVTALIVAIAGLVTAITALWHTLGHSAGGSHAIPQDTPGQVQKPRGQNLYTQAGPPLLRDPGIQAPPETGQ